MRPKHLMLAATALVILGSVLLFVQSTKTHGDGTSPNAPPYAGPAGSDRGGPPRDTAAPPLPPTAQTAVNSTALPSAVPTIKVRKAPLAQLPNPPAAADSPSSALADSPSQATTPPETAPATPAKGIQLAENVKLPAVILAVHAAENDPQGNYPEPVKAAMRGIVDTFYRDLADSAGAADAEGSAAVAPESGDTIVIHPGPAVEQARERANETYRALFGDAAFDRMTMHALMESQLPASPLPGGN